MARAARRRRRRRAPHLSRARRPGQPARERAARRRASAPATGSSGSGRTRSASSSACSPRRSSARTSARPTGARRPRSWRSCSTTSTPRSSCGRTPRSATTVRAARVAVAVGGLARAGSSTTTASTTRSWRRVRADDPDAAGRLRRTGAAAVHRRVRGPAQRRDAVAHRVHRPGADHRAARRDRLGVRVPELRTDVPHRNVLVHARDARARGHQRVHAARRRRGAVPADRSRALHRRVPRGSDVPRRSASSNRDHATTSSLRAHSGRARVERDDHGRHESRGRAIPAATGRPRSSACSRSPALGAGATGMHGRTSPLLQVRIVDPDDREVPPGETGEICAADRP